jgi:hypothetical protein
VRNQREKYRHGVLREDRRQKLQCLGLDLNPRPIHAYNYVVDSSRSSGKKQKVRISISDTALD